MIPESQHHKVLSSELILNDKGTLHHLHLGPEDIGEYVILVGDMARVQLVSRHFDKLEVEKQNREFKTHTGTLNGKRISVISTGIGTDNIDIVVNELDAAMNMDLVKRIPKKEHHSLKIIRLGTSGSVQKDVPVNSFVASAYGLGIDGLAHFYHNNQKACVKEAADAFVKHTSWPENLPRPYVVGSSPALMKLAGKGMLRGITITAPGFYGPQWRSIRLDPVEPGMLLKISTFEWQGNKIMNFEMETSALFFLSAMLGHEAMSVCTVLANRMSGEFADNYHLAVDNIIIQLLENIC